MEFTFDAYIIRPIQMRILKMLFLERVDLKKKALPASQSTIFGGLAGRQVRPSARCGKSIDSSRSTDSCTNSSVFA